MSMFKSSAENAKAVGLGSQSEKKNRFRYHKKKNVGEVFFVRIVPAIQGYDYRMTSKHDNLATLKLVNEHSGTVSDFKISATCRGADSCGGCDASKRQHLSVTREARGKDWFMKTKERKNSQVLLVYPLVSLGGTQFKYQENAEPEILSYSGDWKGITPDWDDLVQLANAMSQKGIDIAHPEEGVVVRVSLTKIPNPKGGAPKNAYVHEVFSMGGEVVRLPLPKGWEAKVNSYSTFDDLNFNFTKEELEFIAVAGERLDELRNGPVSQEAEEEMRKISAEVVDFVKSEPFARVVKSVITASKQEEQAHGGVAAPKSTPALVEAIKATAAQAPQAAAPQQVAQPQAPAQAEAPAAATGAESYKDKLARLRANSNPGSV